PLIKPNSHGYGLIAASRTTIQPDANHFSQLGYIPVVVVRRYRPAIKCNSAHSKADRPYSAIELLRMENEFPAKTKPVLTFFHWHFAESRVVLPDRSKLGTSILLEVLLDPILDNLCE